MTALTRASFYVAAAGAVWLVEGFLFGHMLKFGPVQVLAMAVMYTTLFCLAVVLLVRSLGRQESEGALVAWRLLSLAPMIVVVLGSFVSLPLLLLITAVAKVL